MKLLPTLLTLFPLLATSQSPTPYTDPKSGISFSTFTHPSSGYFFGLALPPANATGNEKDFIATIGGKGSGWSGISLGGVMLGKLLVVAWANGNTGVLGSFRKTR